MKDQKFFDLCAKKLSGSISVEEDGKFSQHIQGNTDNLEAFQVLEKQWLSSGKLRLKYKADPQGAWEKFSQLRSSEKPKTVRWIHFATRLAAMILLTIGLGFLLREFGKTEPFYYATIEGETKWVVLADSSRIKLNENSLLAVSADFNEEQRHVTLKGEAFFEISRDESKPFVIKSKATTTEVLGTSFNIKAIENGDNVEIYVASGKVSFKSKDSELILTRGMAANYDEKNNLLTMAAEDDNALAWHSNTIKFQDTPLDRVFADLQEYFEIEFFMSNDRIKNCRFTGEFKKPKLEDILKVISISTGVTLSKNNNKYTISGEGCKPTN